RLNLAAEKQTYIQPKHSLGERPYRFNWQTPILLSSHNQDILYLGSQKLHRSFNQGDTWTAISGDLTKGPKQGNVSYGTLTTISESPFDFNTLVVGSDDGLVSLTRDSGVTWKSISAELPQDLWVTRVVASAHEASRIYATLNGYRWDDFTPYVYVSEDYGQSWRSLSDGLPLGAVNVIREDPTHADLLYLGTDDGIYVSMDRGDSWGLFDGGLPKVACHDLVVQETASELVAGTHGRSIYIADLNPIQQYVAQGAQGLFVLTPKSVRFSNRWGKSYSDWSAPRMPDFSLEFFSPKQGQATISLKGSGKQAIWEKSVQVAQGYNHWPYDLTLNPDQLKAFKKATGQVVEYKEGAPLFLPKGTYTLEVSAGGQIRSVLLNIE
ncbi:MAG: glycosyl hydrolase, partial [Bacteroidetes bacterium]|nr:glycosyl hydrolase [Bacteroidota bacterium]